MELTYSDDAAEHIRMAVWIRLVEHSLVAVSGGPRFVCVYTRDHDYFFCDLIRNLSESGNIVKHRFALICRTRSDYKDELTALSCENVTDLTVTLLLYLRHFGSYRIFGFDILRNGELSVKFHVHNGIRPFLLYIGSRNRLIEFFASFA